MLASDSREIMEGENYDGVGGQDKRGDDLESRRWAPWRKGHKEALEPRKGRQSPRELLPAQLREVPVLPTCNPLQAPFH